MNGLVHALRAALGDAAVLTAPEERIAFERDWRNLHQHPAVCVVLPKTTAELARAVSLCAGAGVAVVAQGGNTGLVAGGVPVAGVPQVVLSLTRMNRIFAPDRVGNTVKVQAGATVQAVQAAAAAAGLMFGVSFGAQGSAQIGGAISTNAGGIQVLAHASMRANVLGLEVVLADGRVWDGLRAVAKDNTGFDLKQIFIGGEGTLGIITGAVLRLLPAARAHAMALVGVADVAGAVRVFQDIRAHAGDSLTMCEFITRAALELGAAQVTAGRLPFAAANYVLTELSSHTPDAPLAALLETALAPALESGIASDAVIAQSERERLALLRLREAVPEGELAEGGAVKHDIAVPIAATARAVADIEHVIATKYKDCRLNIFGHLGDGNLHVNVRPRAGAGLDDLADRKAAITADVEAIAMAYGGSFSAEHGIGQLRLDGMQTHKSSVELELMQKLKHALDPRGIFNPGKVLPQ
jgi:FAD/FMN-containing dehydrogenase